MNRFVLTFAVALLSLPAYGQPGPQGQPGPEGQPAALYATGEPRPTWVALEAVYQQFSDDGSDISEVSVPLSVHLPIGQSLSLSLRTNYATVSGSDLETTSGIGDVQIVTSYFQEIGAASLVASLGLNATTGTSGLTTDEFRTATIASQTVYDLRVPTFGQGIRVAPSLTVAVPAGERAALGVGVSYQYRGPYEPILDVSDQYDPGEEILLTAGADLQLGEASFASLDLSFGINGTDTWGLLEYEPGNSFAATAQWRQGLGVHEVRTVARYRTRGDGSLPESVAMAETVVPEQLLGLLEGSYQATPDLRLTLLARGRSYSESALFAERQTLVDLGLTPQWSASERLVFVGRFLYTLGSFSGVTAGGGLRVAF